MNNIPMIFRDFEFSANPQSMEIKASSEYNQIDTSTNCGNVQNFLAKPNVISGTGSFAGQNANSDFMKLYELFVDGKKGELLFSGSKPLRVLMTKLTKRLESFEDVVSYDFEFVEVPKLKINPQAMESYYIIKEGENLWHVACNFDINIDDLMRLNDNISNPFNVQKGDRVKVR